MGHFYGAPAPHLGWSRRVSYNGAHKRAASLPPECEVCLEHCSRESMPSHCPPIARPSVPGAAQLGPQWDALGLVTSSTHVSQATIRSAVFAKIIGCFKTTCTIPGLSHNWIHGSEKGSCAVKAPRRPRAGEGGHPPSYSQSGCQPCSCSTGVRLGSLKSLSELNNTVLEAHQDPRWQQW